MKISDFTTLSGFTSDLTLSYQVFGKPLHTAPVVLVNHALTGNSNVSGPDGWWKELIGEGKVIDTLHYTVLAFNIPGNGYDGFSIDNYKDYVARDMARVFLLGLEQLDIRQLHAVIGGSLGGGLAWEMLALKPDLSAHLIAVATDWKSTDWLIANCQIQERFLENSSNPVHDARMHAMLCYRTPVSFNARFGRTTNEELQVFNVESWLLHHGEKLQSRFQLSAYKLMNQLLKTIDITRGKSSLNEVLREVRADIHIIGVDSDLFFTAAENRETYKQLAQNNDRVRYGEIQSEHGHDAFLIETDQLGRLIEQVFDPSVHQQRVKVAKFGGKSLANGSGLTNVLQIIEEKVGQGEHLAVVVSARNDATDRLLELLDLASRRQAYEDKLQEFIEYQKDGSGFPYFEEVFSRLQELLSGVRLLGDYSDKIRDEVMAQGEVLSARYITSLLEQRGIPAVFGDTRDLLVTTAEFGQARPLDTPSRHKFTAWFRQNHMHKVKVITGFIGATEIGETTTLGRNGSNYTAALIANYLDASEMENFTHVNGIYTANPSWVADARLIPELSYNEANELANFGAEILHAKTIIPLLEKNIPLRIRNTYDPKGESTLISARPSDRNAKSLSVLANMALVHLEGRGLLGISGVDARIFNALAKKAISVSIIAQGSSERGIGFIVDADRAREAREALEEEFSADLKRKDVNSIEVNDKVSVISIIGQDLSDFHLPYNALVRNKIVPLLFNNTVTGKNVSLVVHKSDLMKALNVIHGEMFGLVKTVHLAVFGHGTVGGTLLKQLNEAAAKIERRKKIRLRIFAVSNSTSLLLDKKGIGVNWEERLRSEAVEAGIDKVIAYAREHHLENLIAVDNTAGLAVVKAYEQLVEEGFDLVSCNKIANTLPYEAYQNLRKVLEANQKQYLYETNVGAGLPLIDTIRLLHLSGENITRIRGVFSGSLSYLFNRFSAEQLPFSNLLGAAMQAGLTEPDPREDLSGMDVGRKLLILARELDLQNEISDVQIENLVPEALRTLNRETFLEQLQVLDAGMQERLQQLPQGYVLRYVGDLHGDLQQDKGILQVRLCEVPANSALGQLQGADSIFEIYTESYGDRPIVIQGAGAGAAVTARGVFGDILKLAERNHAF